MLSEVRLEERIRPRNDEAHVGRSVHHGVRLNQPSAWYIAAGDLERVVFTHLDLQWRAGNGDRRCRCGSGKCWQQGRSKQQHPRYKAARKRPQSARMGAPHGERVCRAFFRGRQSRPRAGPQDGENGSRKGDRKAHRLCLQNGSKMGVLRKHRRLCRVHGAPDMPAADAG
ncbi:hypothetical protein D3C72_981070 [compost metagenome]